MIIHEKIKSYTGVLDYFEELKFYNKHIQKPKIKHSKSINLLSELPFYEELNMIKQTMYLKNMKCH